MATPPQKPSFRRVRQRRRFPWIVGIIVSIAFLAILTFVIVALVILRSQGISQGINTLTIISIVGSFMIGVFSLLLSFLQWHHARLSGQHQQARGPYSQTVPPDNVGPLPASSARVGPPEQYKESDVSILPHQSQKNHQIDYRGAPHTEQPFGPIGKSAKFSSAEITPLSHSAPPHSALDRRNRRNFLDKVYEIWITGFLEQSLEQEVWIELGMENRRDLLPNPWRFQVQEMEQTSDLLPAGTTIEQVYEQTRQGQLLIVGEPGSGKTTQLLQLARFLIERAIQDEQQPIPAVFNLSSWELKHLSLTEWLAEELRAKYEVPVHTGQAWVLEGRLLPLLDGLDEVSVRDRPAYVEAINTYLRTRLNQEQEASPLVICCRSKEYSELVPRLAVQRAIRLLPLSDEQINAYFQSRGATVEVLWEAVRKDAELHTLARQPLMLSVFTLAYRGVAQKKLPLGKTAEEGLRLVWDAYLDRMLHRRQSLSRWTEQQVRDWLTILAQDMHKRNLTIFGVENLQPDWLPYHFRRLFPWCVGLIMGLVVGVLVCLALGAVFGVIGGLIFGVIGGVQVGRQKIIPTERLGWTWKKFIRSTFAGVVLGAIVGAIGYKLAGDMLKGVVFGVLGGIAFGLLNGIEKNQIITRRVLRPNEGIWRSGAFGLVVGLISGLLVSLAVGTFGSVAFGILTGVVFGTLSGTEKVLRPNKEIWRSSISGFTITVLNGLIFGALGGLVGGVFFGVFRIAAKGLLGSVLDGAVFGILFGMFDGGDAFLLHYTLRFWLWCSGAIPLRFVVFLEGMANRLLLRRVGGNYVFVHRFLLEHFANGHAKTAKNNEGDVDTSDG